MVREFMNDENAVAGEIIYLVVFIAMACILFIIFNPLVNLGSSVVNMYSGMGWLSQTGYETTMGLNLGYQSWPYIIGIIAVIAGISGVLALKKLGAW